MLIVCGLASVAFGQEKAVEIANFDGMAGCWERSDKAKSLLISEQWMKPAGTSLMGMGRTVRGGKTVDFEFMRIEHRVDGVYYVAQPKANAEETAFKLIRSSANEFVFENKAHDFPQRIIYKFEATKMVGRIEGDDKGKFVGIDFPFDRVKCTQ
ncbi:DUF6265 family protein [soil metagenome]